MDFQTISIDEYNSLLQDKQELNQLKEKLRKAEPVTLHSLGKMKDVLSGWYEVGIGTRWRPHYVFFPVSNG